MRLTTGTATRCSGGNHINIPATTGTGQTGTFTYTEEEVLAALQADSFAELRERFLYRLVSAVKEAGATTPLQIRNAISNKVFEV